MPKRNDLKKIMLIGSGPIVIGQACEFDYSGTQACKSLKEEGYEVVLINSNPATIMTDPSQADKTYVEPITPEFVEKVIAKERPCAVLPTLGGQTALNVALDCAERGVFEKYDVELIGASTPAIKAAEDRHSFKDVVADCGLNSAVSKLVRTVEEAEEFVSEIGYPLILRPSRTLGGSGGAIVDSPDQLKAKLDWAFDCSPVSEVLVEESLLGWKEYEVEVMRDYLGNGVIICSIENLDPMGVHTGDSITVAPIQTLTDKEYQEMRNASLKLMNAIGVETGGSNVQFAVCPRTGRQIVIELNPRVSRSSALASKATGFPIAKLAAKLAVGYSLDELPNDITKLTPACFEPTLDYVVVKIPRFTFEKFSGVDDALGTQMKSVGESMAIGGNFIEAFQKASRSLETGRDGLLGGEDEAVFQSKQEALDSLPALKADRVYRAARALELGASIEEVFDLSAFDPWFLEQFQHAVEIEKRCGNELNEQNLKELKYIGTSDSRIASLASVSEADVRAKRLELKVVPGYKSVDTCAAEFKSYTPYLYSTYHGGSDEIPSLGKEKIIVLGGGPNRIGQGLEFDYCCVHAAFSLSDAGYETVMVNCNPETVSTDYDTSDKLFFEPLTLEDVLEIIDFEKPAGVIVQYGGQTPLKLASALLEAGVPIIGTSPEAIDLAEDRDLFRDVVTKVGIKQPNSEIGFSVSDTLEKAKNVGFPLMVRPSFVLGGRAMALVSNMEELEGYVAESVQVSNKKPLLIDKFLQNAVEVDVDAICDGETVVVCGILEHIERAGIHSGDSSFVLPSQTLSAKIKQEIVEATSKLAMELKVKGLMNAQYAVCDDELYVIEVNPRASRSVPFVSKALGMPWAKIAARVMAGSSLVSLEKEFPNVLDYQDYLSAIEKMEYVAVKEAVFPFTKFIGFDAKLGPEMRSTGEVMGLGENLGDAVLRALIGAGVELPQDGKVFFSLRQADKEMSVALAQRLNNLGYQIVATKGTAEFLKEHEVEAEVVNKVREGGEHIVKQLQDGGIKLVINTPEGTAPILDSAEIRSSATALKVPLFTTIAAAEAAVDAIEYMKTHEAIGVCALQDYLS